MENTNNNKEFTIKQIIKAFTEIDKEIQNLQNYSANDFNTFNVVMKQTHKLVNEISGFADKIIELSGIQNNIELLKNLKNKYADVKQNNSEYKTVCKEQNQLLSEFLDLIRHLNLPIKNLKQNIFSIKYILANLKLETFDTNSQNKYSQHINNIEENILKNTHSIKNLEQNISQLQNILERITLIETTQLVQNFEGINNSIDILDNAAALMLKSYKESEVYSPKIKSKITKTSENVNKIVVKLQYQDIIKQKMEHTQAVYKKIINFFKEISNEKQFQDNELLQYYSKIEYIASLQVAQLVQTNKEYEKAIESISEHLLQISLGVNDASYYMRIFTNELPKQEEMFLQWTKKYLSHIKTAKLDIEEIETSFKQEDRELKRLTSNFKKNFEEINHIIEITLQLIQKLDIEKYKNLTKTFNLRKLKEVGSYIKEITDANYKNFANIKPDIWNMKSLKSKNFILSDSIISDFNKKIGKISNNEEVLEEYLKKSIILAKKISDKVNNSIQEVSYYDHFEKSVEKIIFKLNFLNEKLKFSRSEQISKEDIENLNEFENLYTVKTERIIHDLVLNENKTDVEQVEHDEDSDVEFF